MMLDSIVCGSFGFCVGELPVVVAEPIHTASIKARPKRRFGNGHAPGLSHAAVVVGSAGDHMDVRIDVLHGASAGGIAPSAPCIGAASMGSELWSLSII